MNFAELCKARYSLRRFSDRPVEQEKLDLILEAAHNAPTAVNFQPQRIFVLRSPEALAKVPQCSECRWQVPVALLVAYDPKVAWVRDNDGMNHGDMDAALAAGQMMLQAAELGLGTTFVGMLDIEAIHKCFPETEGLVPICVMPLGYPAENARPARLHDAKQPLEDMVTYL